MFPDLNITMQQGKNVLLRNVQQVLISIYQNNLKIYIVDYAI